MKPEDYERFADLLPCISNGTATPEERVFVEDFLARHPEFRDELNFQQDIHDVAREKALQRDAEAGVQQLLQQFDRTQEQKKDLTRSALGERLRAWLHDWSLTPAFAVAATIVVVQGGLLLQSRERADELSIYRSTQGDSPAASIKLIPKQDVSIAALTAVLQEHGLTIVGGPDEQGALWLIGPVGVAPKQLADQLGASGLADDVIVLSAQ